MSGDEMDVTSDTRCICLASGGADCQRQERLRLLDQLRIAGSTGMVGERSMLLRQRGVS
jgi:hypothetical protein